MSLPFGNDNNAPDPGYRGNSAEVQFVTSPRGRVLVLYQSAKYYFERTLKQSGQSKWRCCKKQCCAYVLTSGRRVVMSEDTHNHGPSGGGGDRDRAQHSAASPEYAETAPTMPMLMPPPPPTKRKTTVIAENQQDVPDYEYIDNMDNAAYDFGPERSLTEDMSNDRPETPRTPFLSDIASKNNKKIKAAGIIMEETNSNIKLRVVRDKNSMFGHAVAVHRGAEASTSRSPPFVHISSRTQRQLQAETNWPSVNYSTTHREFLRFHDSQCADDDSDSVMLHSFLPLVNKLNDTQKLDFQLYVLQFFKDVMKPNDVARTANPAVDSDVDMTRPYYPCPRRDVFAQRNPLNVCQQLQQQHDEQQQQQQQYPLALNTHRSRHIATPNMMPRNHVSRSIARDASTSNNGCPIVPPPYYFTPLN